MIPRGMPMRKRGARKEQMRPRSRSNALWQGSSTSGTIQIKANATVNGEEEKDITATNADRQEQTRSLSSYPAKHGGVSLFSFSSYLTTTLG